MEWKQEELLTERKAIKHIFYNENYFNINLWLWK